MSQPKIFQLIPMIMREVGAIEKRGHNPHGDYKFRSIDDVYNKLHPVLAKHGVFFVPSVLTSSEERFNSKSGAAQLRIKLKVEYKVYCDDGSFFSTVVEGEGIDSGDKATNKALTAAFKYMLIQVFCLAVENMDDADKSSPDMAPITTLKKPNLKAPVEIDPGEYVPTFGKFKGKKLSALDPYEVVSYVQYIEGSAQHDGKALQGKVLEFIKYAKLLIDKKMERPAALEAN